MGKKNSSTDTKKKGFELPNNAGKSSFTSSRNNSHFCTVSVIFGSQQAARMLGCDKDTHKCQQSQMPDLILCEIDMGVFLFLCYKLHGKIKTRLGFVEQYMVIKFVLLFSRKEKSKQEKRNSQKIRLKAQY